MLTTKTKKEKTTGRRYPEDFPGRMEAQAIEGDLREQLRKVAAKEADLAKQLASGALTNTVVAAREARVQQLLAGKLESAPAEKDDPRARTASSLSEARKEMCALSEAIGRQTEVVRAATVLASREICRALTPEYRALAQATIDTWFNLIAAIEAEEAFRANLRAEGVNLSTLPSLDITEPFKHTLGSSRGHPNGAFRGLVESAKREGYTLPESR